jgi:hypothetical protein
VEAQVDMCLFVLLLVLSVEGSQLLPIEIMPMDVIKGQVHVGGIVAVRAILQMCVCHHSVAQLAQQKQCQYQQRFKSGCRHGQSNQI